MNKIWITIYNKWLIEGDLKVLLYLRKIQRYLSHGRIKSQQEVENLMAQVNSMLDLPYHGEYSYLQTGNISNIDIVWFKPTGPIRLPDTENIDQIATYLLNIDGIRIKPQNTDHFCTHPLWILWTMCDRDEDPNGVYHCAIWVYRELFFEYMYMNMYHKAAMVFKYALNIKVRKDPLPLWHSEVLKHIMYVRYQPCASTSPRATRHM